MSAVGNTTDVTAVVVPEEREGKEQTTQKNVTKKNQTNKQGNKKW